MGRVECSRRLLLCFLVGWGGVLLVWIAFFYGNWPVISIADADVCPIGSRLGGEDTCNATRREGQCYGGTLESPCRCAEGYQPRVTRFTLSWEAYHFRCCSSSGGEGPAACGDPSLLGVLAPLCLGAGVVGCIACIYLINCAKPIVEGSRPEDSAAASPVPRDGAKLHDSVEMRRWAVTLSDLQQFRRLVLQAVRDGQIKPTDRDPFDPSDFVKGPSMYTVTEQYIKPVTEAAGKMSWALMKHPDGIDCDLFITHGWAEGVFEFADKVTYCWPRGATAAYVCFLSNPQNLDIAHLIASPEQSPFARALTASQQMLVVPNSQASIYTRIWCVYEAFLAYTLKKPIYTALSPVLHFWPRVLRIYFACMVAYGVGFFVAAAVPADRSADSKMVEAAAGILTVLSSLVMIFFFKTRRPESKVLEVSIYVYGAALSVYFNCRAYERGFKRDTSVVYFVLSPFVAVGLETDRLLALALLKQSKQLKAGFQGIREAQSSNPTDRERIQNEIEATGAEAEVDGAISVLLDMGQSSSGLREVTKRTGPLGDISSWSRTLFFVSLNWWIVNANQLWSGRVLRNDPRQNMPDWLRPVVFSAALLECVAFLTMFVLFPPHRKAFAERSQILLVIFIVISVAGPWSESFQSVHLEYATAFALNPLVLFLSACGPALLARVPLVGVPLVRAFFGRNPFRAAQLRSPPKMEAAPEEDASFSI